MGAIWRSLAWKEWHEHKWKLAALAAILCGLSVAGLFEVGIDESLLAVWLICLIPAAVFLGLEAAAGETSRGTLAFLQALPIPLWRIALTKLAAGLFTLLIASCLAVGTVYVWAAAGHTFVGWPWPPVLAFHTTAQWVIYLPLILIGISGSFYLWTAATGANRQDEISAAAVALACILGCWLLVIAGRMAIVYSTNTNEPVWLRTLGLALAPGGFMGLVPLRTPPGLITFGVVVSSLVHLALAVWYVKRFGHGPQATIRSLEPAAAESVDQFSPPPRRSQLTAIIWKQWRESVPIVLVGLGGAAGLVTLTMAVAVLQDATGEPTDYSEWFGHMTLMASIIFGLMVAVVAGMGAYLFDLGDRLSTFWRSRPISVDLWFWTKFFTGLIIVVVAFQLPMSLGHFTDDSVNAPGFRQSLALLWQIAAYSTAAAGICLVRRPMYAVLLGVATLYAAWVAFIVVLGWLLNLDLQSDVPLSLTAIGLSLYSVAAALIAWLAVRYDWGWNAQRA